jgi:hypothetical protein
MLEDIEYTFSILNYKLKNDAIVAFEYYISMYYKDGIKPGYHQETKEYVITDRSLDNFRDINDIVNYILEVENIQNIEESSLFISCYNSLKINSIDCCGSKWSLSNVKK